MFRTIADFFLDGVASILAFCYALPVVGGSYGRAIILLTLVIMIILMPLTLRATRSTIKMAQMQPKLKALQKKYKNDKQAMNAEVLSLYKENKISPVGGCLPILAQMPVFLILFNVIRGITQRVSGLPYYGVSTRAWDLTSQPIVDSDTFFPDYLNEDSALYKSLRQDTSMDFGPLDLGARAWDVIQSSFVSGLPYVLLILFVVGSSYYQQYQVQARRGPGAPEINPQQKIIMRVLPLLSGIWGVVFPAGLVLYWATSNAFRIGQQTYITRSIYGNSDNQVDIEESDVIDVEEVEASSDDSSSQTKKSSKSEREKQWAERRRQKAKSSGSKSNNKSPNNQSSSRTTPKGTKPSASKKNRKR